MIERIIHVKDYLTKSGLSIGEYSINPYVGCPHKCKYCFASYMNKYHPHCEKWGDFVDVKIAPPINLQKLNGSHIVLSSVTDPYNPAEDKFFITQNILKQLLHCNAEITIITKSSLILRDLDILKKIKNLTVFFSINTIDENFRRDMDSASTITQRIHALEVLHSNNIKTGVLVSPIFPGITDCNDIIKACKHTTDKFIFEPLNLKTENKFVIFDYISNNYPHLLSLYHQIYKNNDLTYWDKLKINLAELIKEQGVNGIIYG